MVFLSRFKNFDWILLAGFAFIAAAGLLTLSSSEPAFFYRQLTWYAAGFLIIFLGSMVDWRWLGNQAWFRYGLYWVSVLLLLISNFQHTTIRGTKSWLLVGGFQFEPSEFAKLALILVLAHFFTRRHVEAWYGKNIFLSFFYAVIPMALILIHPDLGSAVVMFCLWLGFLLAGGVHKRRLLLGTIFFILLLLLSWNFVLKPYQKDRLTGFLFPERDPLGINYNVIQSKIAIGSGGFWGKGYDGGTQVKLHFLPEARADFLFAAFIEEWGVFGGILLLLTFMLIFFRLVTIGLRARDNYSRFLVLGTGLFLIVHFFINVGSNVGLVPVSGIPLPFFSYGGSNLLTTALLIGILEHIKLESSA